MLRFDDFESADHDAVDSRFEVYVDAGVVVAIGFCEFDIEGEDFIGPCFGVEASHIALFVHRFPSCVCVRT